MNLSKLIQIDNRFEKSVNLLLDLNNPNRIRLYIPTRSSISILSDYLDSVMQNRGENASLLIGPYGKGKSHLLLVLLAMLSKNKTPEMEDLIKRIDLIDKTTSKKAKEILKDKRPYLPVIVSAGSGDLKQSFLRSLMQALKRDGLLDVAPSTHYSEAINTICSWEKSYPQTFKALKSRLKEYSLDVTSLREALASGDRHALSVFKDVYPLLTSGGSFNPLIEDELINIYKSVNRELCDQKGYAGIFIVFDEFSKYIEGHSKDTFSADMKILQDMCELANSSKEERLHICLVAHKNIKSYGKSLPKEVLNAFKGVEGRLIEKYFIVSSQNNYELIADAIIKSNNFSKWYESNVKLNNIASECYSLHLFKSLFDKEDYYNIVAKGCYPMTPIAAMMLLTLSEKVAQNERTVFTFLTDKGNSGISGFINNPDASLCVNCDKIYDYFLPLFKEDQQMVIHEEWLKSDYAISNTSNKDAQLIIKSLAIIRMINNSDDLAANDNLLMLATGLSKGEYKKALSELLDNNLIVFRDRTGAYEFKNNIGIDIERAISNTIATNYTNVNIPEIITGILKENVIMPKKHNQDNCLTRYFNIKVMDESTFLSLSSTGYLEWNNNPDGAIILVLPKEKLKTRTIINHVKELNDNCLVVCLPNTKESCENKVRYYEAVCSLLFDRAFIDDNQILQKELELIVEDLEYTLNDWINETYFNSPAVYSLNGREEIGIYGLNRLISEICDKAYCKTPLINNENINRHCISSQYLKARNNVLKDILQGNDIEKYLNGSSAESTIGRSVLFATTNDSNLEYVVKKIKSFIKKAEGTKVPFNKLYDVLTQKPIGMRKGIIPIYLAYYLVQLDDMPVIYFGDKELPLNVEALNNINNAPNDYSLFVEKETIQKELYISTLEKLFEDYANHCREIESRNRLAKLTCMMQAWYRSLPQSTKTFKTEDYSGQPINEIKAFRKLFMEMYLNPREFLFEKIPKISGTNDYESASKLIKLLKKEIEAHIHNIKSEAVLIIRRQFGFNESNLRLNLSEWADKNIHRETKSIFSTRTKSLIEVIRNAKDSDEEELANHISKSILGMYTEDWNDESFIAFENALKEIKEEVFKKANILNTKAQCMAITTSDGKEQKFVCDYNPENPSPSGYFFKNALDEMIEEYGDSVDTEEKIGILLDLINKMLK